MIHFLRKSTTRKPAISIWYIFIQRQASEIWTLSSRYFCSGIFLCVVICIFVPAPTTSLSVKFDSHRNVEHGPPKNQPTNQPKNQPSQKLEVACRLWGYFVDEIAQKLKRKTACWLASTCWSSTCQLAIPFSIELHQRGHMVVWWNP